MDKMGLLESNPNSGALSLTRTRRLKAVYTVLVLLAVYSCVLIYAYCLILFGTLDESMPPYICPQENWIIASCTCTGMSVGTYQRILVLIILSFVYELLASIILFVGAYKKNAYLCNVWIYYLSIPAMMFKFILLIHDTPTFTLWTTVMVLMWIDSWGIAVATDLWHELENDLDWTRNSDMAVPGFKVHVVALFVGLFIGLFFYYCLVTCCTRESYTTMSTQLNSTFINNNSNI